MAGTDNVEKGIRRGDAEVALQALLRLAPPERAPFIEQVGALFRVAVQADHRARNWSKLMSWASRAERIPGLEGLPGSPEFFATHWALTWGAVKTKEWDRARRWWQPLSPVLRQQAPAFAAALEAVVSGGATPEVVAPFLTAPSPDDPRLGKEPKRRHLEWKAPTSAEDVERTLLSMVGREPWGVFAANVTQWAPLANEASRGRMLELAGHLATRETVKRLASSQAHPGEPAVLLRFAVESLGAPASLADEALLVFRMLAARMPREVRAVAAAREFTQGALAASAYEALRPLVGAVLTRLTFTPEAAGPVLKLIDHLLGQQPDVALLGKALLLLSNFGPEGADAHRPSPVLVRAFSTTITTDAAALGRWFDGLTPQQRKGLAGWMSFVLPVELVQAFVPAAWPWVAPAARKELVWVVENVLLRLRDLHLTSDLDDLDDWLDDDDPLEGPLPPQARPFWNAVRDLVLPEDLVFLPFALREARGERPLELVTRALGEKPTIEKLIGAWDLLRRDKHPAALTKHVEAQIFQRHGRDLHALIHGVMEAQRLALPVALKRKLAEALWALRDGACDCPDFERALVLAERWLKPKARAKKKSKGPPPPDDDPIPF